MDLAAFRTELLARGFDYLNQTRQDLYINAGRAELDRMFLWPWREATASGAAPLAVADLGVVASVVNTAGSDTRLSRLDRQTLLEAYGDLSTAGTPWVYFIDWSSGSRVVRVYPVSTDTIEVRYWKVTADLALATDAPAAPAEAHPLIVDLAVSRAYRDTDDHARAQALQAEIDRQVAQLLVQYPPGQADGPDAFAGVTFASEDW